MTQADLPTDDLDWACLLRYLVGEASAEDEQWVKRWIAADPGRRELLDRARGNWKAARDRGLPTWNTELSLRKLRARIERRTMRRAASTGAPGEGRSVPDLPTFSIAMSQRESRPWHTHGLV